MRAKEFVPNVLVIFDIDDTLVNTQTEVHVVKDGKTIASLNSHDFTHYKLQPGESFDFKDFRNAKEFFEKSKPIIPMMDQLKRDISRGNDVVMVTARADMDDKELFLDTFRKYGVNVNKLHIYRAGNLPSGSTEERKKKIIKSLLDKKSYTKAIMYDDAIPNLQLFASLKKDHPKTMFYAWHVSPDGNASEFMREDQHPNDKPAGPETKPTMPRGSIRIKVSDVYDWYKLGQHISDLPHLDKNDFGKGPPEAVIAFGSEEEEHKYIKLLQKLGLEILDVDPGAADAPGVETDPTYNTENFADGKKFVEPNFNSEWEEAERYPEFQKIGKEAWIKLAKKGKEFTIKSAKGINNTDAADPDSFKSLDPNKQKRALAQLEKGTIEMPIVAVYSDGYKELIGGNTRLTAMMARDSEATVWAFKVPDEVAELAENFADGKKKGKSRPGRVKKAGASCKGSISSLRAKAAKYSGEKGKMYHWCANMKGGKK